MKLMHKVLGKVIFDQAKKRYPDFIIGFANFMCEDDGEHCYELITYEHKEHLNSYVVRVNVEKNLIYWDTALPGSSKTSYLW